MRTRTKVSSLVTACLIILAAVLPSGCKKASFGFWGRPGDEIKFAIRSGSPATKTVYNNNNGQYFSIETTDGEHTTITKYEGIDWVEGDALTVAYIYYENSSLGVDLADYYIDEGSVVPSAISNGRVLSKGTLKSVKPNGLQWHDGPVHQFYASYPALDENYPDVDSFIFEIDGNGLIHAEVPYYYPMTLSSSDLDDMTKNGRVWMENMKYAYMNTMNGEPANTEKGGTVTMNVGPHFTAFEFEVRANGTDVIPVKSFSLSCSDPDPGDNLIGGTFFLMAKYEDPDEHGNRELWWDNVPLEGEGKTSNTITLDFSGETEYEDGGVVLTNSNPIKFTIFMRGGWSLGYMTIGFDIIKDGARVNRSLKLSYDDANPLDNYTPWIYFSSNCKHRIYGLEIPLNLNNTLWFEGADAGGYEQIDWNL